MQECGYDRQADAGAAAAIPNAIDRQERPEPEARVDYHLVGVSGVGMSALAQALLAGGYTVSGSDRDLDRGLDLEVNRKLRAAGVRFVPQDGSGVGAGLRGVVVSTAIEKDNPELAAAAAAGVPVLHLAALLATLTDGRRCIAVTGTSGKSTVTGMLGWMLEQVGADPTVVNGAPVVNWDEGGCLGNVRAGHTDLWVIEADESDRSLLRYHPDWAIITNASADHFTLEETVKLFTLFSSRVKRGLISALNPPECLTRFRPEVFAGGSRFGYGGVSFTVNVPGRHNAENGLQAVLLGELLGYPLPALSRALAGFRGIRRRLEPVGAAGGVAVFDDYGHNPAKIRAAWETLQPHHAGVHLVWRPHGYRPLALMLDDLTALFTEVCRPTDRVLILPVYDAGGTADRSTQAGELVERLQAAGVPAEGVEDYAAAVARVSAAARPGDAVITMGARDPGLPALARQLVAALAQGAD